jgi:hypothetical protein
MKPEQLVSAAAEFSFPDRAEAVRQQQDFRRRSVSWKNLSWRSRIA